MDDDHDPTANIDPNTLIKIAKPLRRGKAAGPNNIHNEDPIVPSFSTVSYLPHTNRPHPNCMETSYPQYATETQQTPLPHNQL